jgi:hypothetical protein
MHRSKRRARGNDTDHLVSDKAIGRLWRQSSLHERRAGVPSLRPVATSIDVRRDRQKGPKQWLAVRLHELPFACLRRRSKRRATGNAPNAYEPSVPKQGLPLSDGGRLGARGLISGRFSAIKDSGVGTEKGRLGILQSPEGSYGAERAAIPWPN